MPNPNFTGGGDAEIIATIDGHKRGEPGIEGANAKPISDYTFSGAPDFSVISDGDSDEPNMM